LENVRLFLSQGPEWKTADADIVELRAGLRRKELPGTDKLRAAVASEVAYSESLWAGNYDLALNDARSVLGHLGGDELKGYRAFWYYLAGSAACLAARAGKAAMQGAAREMFDNARKATHGVRWLYELAMQPSHRDPNDEPVDPRTLALIERLEERFMELGTLNNRKYDELEQSIRSGLAEQKAGTFEAAQQQLGWLLGFESNRSKEQGSPDPWWVADDEFCLVFEDYSEADELSAVSVTKARQVASHPRWIRERLNLKPEARVLPVLLTDASYMMKEAQPHLQDVYLWRLKDFREWATGALLAMRQLRTTFTEPGDLAWRADASSAMLAAKIAPSAITTLASTKAASALKLKDA
jgi:hypothetical protein